MTTITIDTHAEEKIKASRHKLRAGSWGGSETVCMMSALVAGADSAKDCVTAGWPLWLAELNVALFDVEVGAESENTARYQFALDVAKAVQEPRDYDKAHDLFLISRLDTGDYSALKSLALLDGDWTQQRNAVEAVVALLRRRIAGEDVSAHADAAVNAAVNAAAYADADRWAADASAYAARAYAADASAYATASAAASAAARADLINAICNA